MNRDESNLQRLKDGEPDAYESLVKEYQDRLFRFFFCQHRNHHLAEEQLSETFEQLVRSLPNMKCGENSLPAFVFSVARRVRSQAWRKKARANTLELTVEISDTAANAETQVEKREHLQLVLEAIGRMKAERRDVFLLRFVEGYSNDQIADALEIPMGSVKSHIHRGRTELREFFTKMGFEI